MVEGTRGAGTGPRMVAPCGRRAGPPGPAPGGAPPNKEATVPQRTTTPQERQRRREEQRARLASATEELLMSEGWRRWLRARATFHRYSLLIWRAGVIDRM